MTIKYKNFYFGIYTVRNVPHKVKVNCKTEELFLQGRTALIVTEMLNYMKKHNLKEIDYQEFKELFISVK